MPQPRFVVPFAVMLIGCPAMLPADVRDSTGYAPSVSSFSLYYDRYETDLDIENMAVETRIEKLGIRFTQALAQNLSGDIDLGYVATSQGENPVTGSNKQYGEYLGLGLSTRVPLTQRTALGADLGYAYHAVDGDVNDIETEMSWREARARGYVDLEFPAARFRVGAQAQHIDGDISFDTSPEQTRVFDAEDGSGAFAGVDLFVDTGRISLYGQTGDRRGFSLTFSADY